jgi:hypothetical protein
MTQNNQYYTFYFKLAYTCQSKIYFVRPNITISQFIDDIKMRARGDFDLTDTEGIEIVITGQYDNVNGRDPELAPAIQPSNTLLSEFYRNTLMNTSFYIRKIPNNLNINIPINNNNEDNFDISVPRLINQYVGYENV